MSPRQKRTFRKRPKELRLSVPEIIFIMQYWHQRDRAWGRMVTERELVAADIGIRMRRKMLAVWSTFDSILTPGHFALEPGDIGIGAPRAKSRRR